ncbi:MAG: Thymidylate kinase [uncultured Rubellimicrobium sp.]|uniref:Thymidylate kinase n=1 Tax=uncultured Rubellimicrobium sp. TaxID=543078 RepID=A0A6J4NL38_9RHOB|nr:MAG: Thymidylate kinase [uncultured Rubellimicrobium sp.]
MESEAQGLFISFEGIDGSGKSTQARRLAERLREMGREVVLTREPGGSPGGEEIRRLVLTGDRGRWSPETEILLFTASRRDHLEKTIRPALARGAIVVTDRFADSTRLYQGATRGDLRGVVDKLHDLVIGTEPDLTVLIDMPPETALGRSLRRLAAQDRDAAPTGSSSDSRLMNKQAGSSVVAFGPTTKAGHGVAEMRGDPAPTQDSAAAPEDRFESFGLAFQERIRQGFLDLAREAQHRIVVIDGDRAEEEVAADVAAVALVRLSSR